MLIYVGHSKKIDYENDLYKPLRKLSGYEFVLPHDKNTKPFKSKDLLKTCNAMIAEVSIPSTSLGVEIGWADSYGLKIILLIKKGADLQSSLKYVTNNIIEYESGEDLTSKLKKFL